jgi:hypothetical protein
LKALKTYFLSLLANLFPIFFASKLKPLSMMPAAMGFAGFNPYPNGHYKYYGRSNGASKKGRSNRLQMSINTRNRARRRNKH